MFDVFKVVYKDELNVTNSHVAIVTFIHFWCRLDQEFAILLKCTFEVIIPFQNTYLYEAGFSPMIKQNIDLN